jgi:hypothetical protein
VPLVSHNIWCHDLEKLKATREALYKTLYPLVDAKPPVQQELKPAAQPPAPPIDKKKALKELIEKINQLEHPDEIARQAYFTGKRLKPEWSKNLKRWKKEAAKLEKEVGV